jgi:UDP-N-acetylglucosamine--N-acetylmuramyl-(pentapeptide) pyrophosphoryl-undecaprenol N-acetylglucosamine transferase
MSAPSRHLIVVAAGTGGHVMPGLAVADEMLSRGWTVSWVGTSHGMENDLVAKRGITFDALAFAGMRGKGLLHFFGGGLRLLRALAKSVAILSHRKPAVIFGTGGYVCVPVGLVAGLFRRPLVLLNADAALLMSNRMLARLTRRIAFGFPGAYAGLESRATWTGNPVRVDVASMPEPTERTAGRSGPLRLLVIGGSLGAMVLNETVPKALARLDADARPVVVHQSGARHADTLRGAYAEAGVEAEVLPFIDDMAARYSWADLVVCRAGAITVSELCAAGIPAILVPFSASTTGHQKDNAVFMAQAGAGLHLPQAELTPERLANELSQLTRGRLVVMGTAARTLAKPQAAQAVADLIEAAVRP